MRLGIYLPLDLHCGGDLDKTSFGWVVWENLGWYRLQGVWRRGIKGCKHRPACKNFSCKAKGSRATAEVRAGHKKADSRAGINCSIFANWAGHKKADSRAGINCSIFANRWGRSNKQGKLGEAGGQEALLELIAEPARGDWAQSQTGHPWGGQGGGMCGTSAGRRTGGAVASVEVLACYLCFLSRNKHSHQPRAKGWESPSFCKM